MILGIIESTSNIISSLIIHYHIDLIKKVLQITVSYSNMMFTFSAVPEDGKDFAGLLADVSSYTKAELKHLLEPLVIKG